MAVYRSKWFSMHIKLPLIDYDCVYGTMVQLDMRFTGKKICAFNWFMCLCVFVCWKRYSRRFLPVNHLKNMWGKLYPDLKPFQPFINYKLKSFKKNLTEQPILKCFLSAYMPRNHFIYTISTGSHSISIVFLSIFFRFHSCLYIVNYSTNVSIAFFCCCCCSCYLNSNNIPDVIRVKQQKDAHCLRG